MFKYRIAEMDSLMETISKTGFDLNHLSEKFLCEGENTLMQSANGKQGGLFIQLVAVKDKDGEFERRVE